MKCDCGEKATIRYQLPNGEIIDVCYECFKILIEVMKGNNK